MHVILIHQLLFPNKFNCLGPVFKKTILEFENNMKLSSNSAEIIFFFFITVCIFLFCCNYLS